MATLKKYNLKGQEIGTVEVDSRLAEAEANSQLIKDYIVALNQNARQWSAHTKGRSEVKHTTKKPRPQKGTGNARQGSLVAPQFRGGGVVFGPRAKFDQHVRINRKERKAALRAIIGQHIRDGKICVVDSFNLETPKTKKMTDFLKSQNISRRALFLGESEYVELENDGRKLKVSVHCSKHDCLIKSVRNIPYASFALATNLNGYDAMVAKNIILTEEALNELTNWLC
ncbi:MAG: 50S ribosomal protein L4 [Chlamydiales bacterium]